MVILDCLKQSMVSLQRSTHIDHHRHSPRHTQIRPPSPNCHCSCHYLPVSSRCQRSNARAILDTESSHIYSTCQNDLITKDKRDSSVLSHQYQRNLQSSCYASPCYQIPSSRDSNYCDIAEVYEYSANKTSTNNIKVLSTVPSNFKKHRTVPILKYSQVPKNILHLTRINPFKFATMEPLQVNSRLIVFSLVDTFTRLSPNKIFENYINKLKEEGTRSITVYNLSEPIEYMKQTMNVPVCEFGWPEKHAPSLERLCTLCKSIDSWLALDSIRNIAIIYSKRDLSRASLVIAVFLQYIKICNADDTLFDYETMHNYYRVNLQQYLQPSQKRYVQYFKGLLSGESKINNQQFYLNQIILNKIPNFDGNGLCRPFVKIYQGLALIYSSPVAHINLNSSNKLDMIVFELDPAIKLRGEILIKWYHKRINPTSRTVMFSVQFHTGTLSSSIVQFNKDQIDIASYDKRFQPETSLQLVFNEAKLHITQKIEFFKDDEITKWNSYENFFTEDTNLEYTKGPLDGSLYATVSKRPTSSPNLNDTAHSEIILDELLKKILLEIDSFPDTHVSPVCSPTIVEQSVPSPLSSYEPSVANQSDDTLNESNFLALDQNSTNGSEECVNSSNEELTWLQKQQLKLKNRKNNTQQKRTVVEKKLIEELKCSIKSNETPQSDHTSIPEVPVRTTSRNLMPLYLNNLEDSNKAVSPSSKSSNLQFSPQLLQSTTPERVITSEMSIYPSRDEIDSCSSHPSQHQDKLVIPSQRSSTPAFPIQSRNSIAFSFFKDDHHSGATPLFVKDTSHFWYKPNISREEAVKMLRDKPSGTFIIRDSNSFQGAYGLAVKVVVSPSDPKIPTDSVRHFLIESTSKGVQIKGCPEEPVFGSLAALVYQHSITKISLPILLQLPTSSIESEEDNAYLLQLYGAACNVLYFACEDVESLTGKVAVKKVVDNLFEKSKNVKPFVVHFNASKKGITLTDNSHKMFFRQHYPLNAISFCDLDQDRRFWAYDNESVHLDSGLFGFVAHKKGSPLENVCLVFGQFDHDQPSHAIVDFINQLLSM